MPAVSAQTPDKRLLWHPRNENKFVVGGGTDITLYEWAPDQPEIRHVTSQHDLQFMKVNNVTVSLGRKAHDILLVLCMVPRFFLG